MENKKETKNALFGPVVIGGIGGSGTRVAAEIISVFGFYLGDDLNGAKDNLLYTLLFKRPNWYYRHKDNEHTIEKGLNIFHKIMTRRRSFTLGEMMFVFQAVFSLAFFGHNYKGRGLKFWPFKRIQKLLIENVNIDINYVGWGWKEPNSHLLIGQMAEHFNNFKYIHTIRHGLDMAFSRNQNQLFNWGPLYGVNRPKFTTEIPAASLKYWIRANQQVLMMGERLGSNKFLKINFEKLCYSPESEINKIIDFLDIHPDRPTVKLARELPKKPESMGRYRNYDLSQFERSDLDMLTEFGYSIE